MLLFIKSASAHLFLGVHLVHLVKKIQTLESCRLCNIIILIRPFLRELLIFV